MFYKADDLSWKQILKDYEKLLKSLNTISYISEGSIGYNEIHRL